MDQSRAKEQPKPKDVSQEDRRSLKLLLELIEQKKGERTIILDLRELFTPTSYFVITEGATLKQIQAIAGNIIEKFPGASPLEEGLKGGNWVVLDYGDLMIHIFQKETRRFYDLEGLWGEVEIRFNGEHVRFSGR